jgi:AcrR family transcriptional regulator
MAQALAREGKRLPAEKRREHLLDVAAEILLEQGFDALTMEAVKARGGISRGLAYLHFANAEELAFALYDREVTELDRRLDAASAGAAGFEDRVRAAMKTYLDFSAEHRGLLALLQISLTGRWSRPRVLEQLGRRFRFWSDEIAREFGVSSSVAMSLAWAAVAGVEAFATAWRLKQLTRAQAESMAIAFVLAGLRDAVTRIEKR